jgi:hypothetical protein
VRTLDGRFSLLKNPTQPFVVGRKPASGAGLACAAAQKEAAQSGT